MQDPTDETVTLNDDETLRVAPQSNGCFSAGCEAEITIADTLLRKRVIVHLDRENREIVIRALGGEA